MKENMAHKHVDNTEENQLASADLLDGIIDITEAVSEVAHPLEGIANALMAEARGSSNVVTNGREFTSEANGSNLHNPVYKEGATSLDSFLLFKTMLQTAFTYERAYIACARTAQKAGLVPASRDQPTITAEKTATNITTESAAASAAGTATAASTTTESSAATATSTTAATLPPPNLIVVPCLASIPSEVWLAVLAEVPNIDIFLPPFSCDKCPVNEEGVAEKNYAKAISSAEAAVSRGPGLVGDVKEITTRHQRASKREHFVESVSRLPQALLQGKALQSFEEQAAARAEAIMADLYTYMRAIRKERSLATPPHELPEDFNRVEAGSKKLIRPARLTKEQVLLLATLQMHPTVAQHYTYMYPVRNQALCTLCGACQITCPTQAIQFRRDNSFQVSQEACRANAGCDACERICPVHAIHYEACDAKHCL